MLARTVMTAWLSRPAVDTVTRPEPASMTTPAGAASSAKLRPSPEKPAWVETVWSPLPCSNVKSPIGPRTAGAASGAATVTRNPSAALPPEFVAVTVTRAATIAVSVGRLSTPVAASMLAPAPVTAKLSAAPLKCGAIGTTKSPLPSSSSRSPRLPAATGATWVTRTGSVTASKLPAALLALTAQLISARSSAATGR